MKGAHHDPVDHARTYQPRAGESMIDTLWFPGLLLIALGVIGLAAIVASAADITTATREHVMAVPIQALTVREVLRDDQGQIVRQSKSDRNHSNEDPDGQEKKEELLLIQKRNEENGYTKKR